MIAHNKFTASVPAPATESSQGVRSGAFKSEDNRDNGKDAIENAIA